MKVLQVIKIIAYLVIIILSFIACSDKIKKEGFILLNKNSLVEERVNSLRQGVDIFSNIDNQEVFVPIGATKEYSTNTSSDSMSTPKIFYIKNNGTKSLLLTYNTEKQIKELLITPGSKETVTPFLKNGLSKVRFKVRSYKK